MSQLQVLIVEDEMIVAMEIKNYLQHLECQVVAMVTSSEDAMDAIGDHSIDLVVMDIYLEGEVDGIESAMMIKKINPLIEIIFLSANSDDGNLDRAAKLLPLAYLSKPFNRQELYVAITILKAKGKKREEIILDKTFSYNPKSKILYEKGNVVELTKKERALLALLLEYKEHIVSYSTIEFVLWSDKIITPNTLRSLVRRLREKLKHRFIKTHANEGYRLTLN